MKEDTRTYAQRVAYKQVTLIDPFIALMDDHDEIATNPYLITVDGISDVGTTEYPDVQFVVVASGYNYRKVYLNTPENMKALDEYVSIRLRHSKEYWEMHYRHESERDKALAVVVTLTPENYQEVLSANQKPKE